LSPGDRGRGGTRVQAGICLVASLAAAASTITVPRPHRGLLPTRDAERGGRGGSITHLDLHNVHRTRGATPQSDRRQHHAEVARVDVRGCPRVAPQVAGAGGGWVELHGFGRRPVRRGVLQAVLDVAPFDQPHDVVQAIVAAGASGSVASDTDLDAGNRRPAWDAETVVQTLQVLARGRRPQLGGSTVIGGGVARAGPRGGRGGAR